MLTINSLNFDNKIVSLHIPIHTNHSESQITVFDTSDEFHFPTFTPTGQVVEFLLSALTPDLDLGKLETPLRSAINRARLASWLGPANPQM